jgi:hypothetical protein
MSALGVDWVAATAAGSTGLRGGEAVRWRVAGAGGGSVAVVAGATAAGFCLVPAVAAVGPALRVIGRGFGMGTFGLAQAPVASPDNPTASIRLVATTDVSTVVTAFDRNAGVRAKGVTVVLRSESIDRVRIC